MQFVNYLCLAIVWSLASCGNRPIKASKIQESPDSMNLRSQFGLTKQLTWSALKGSLSVSLKQVPWTDTYWPLKYKETAARWEELNVSGGEEVGFGEYMNAHAAQAINSKPSPLLSPAEKYDLVYQIRHDLVASQKELMDFSKKLSAIDASIKKSSDIKVKRTLLRDMISEIHASGIAPSLSMTMNGWEQFLSYSSDESYRYLSIGEGESWGWMGICHGWAPAAVMTPAPKHAAMAIIGDKKVLFTEGDIRGLLSRSWAQRAPGNKNYFLGRRCNKDVGDTHVPIPANSNGKGYAGTVTLEGSTKGFTVIDTLLSLKVPVNSRLAEVFKIQFDADGDEKILLEVGGRSFYLVANFADLASYLKTGEMSLLTRVEAELTGCWDVNPASFHEVLVEQLGVRGNGFVMDRTRNGQVWNQPIYSAIFEIGDLKRVGSVVDVAARYRSSGTMYIAEVSAAVSWIREPSSAQLTYPGNFDKQHSSTTVYNYTLEFDADERLIGGEWGTFSKMDPGSQAPDFLFGYEADAEPIDNVGDFQGKTTIDYSGIVKKLLVCSWTDDTDGVEEVSSQKLSYKNCVIEKAQ
ncbi:MAG: hypothetical protein NTV34_07965 [Proteobacteria bacterium]|nr:hypothetical protein [Pseudomonadota bacterium]